MHGSSTMPINNKHQLDDVDSPIRDFYRGKVVFLTGATGVLGELFVEKLLRCGVSRVFILLRTKKQKSHIERVQETYSTALFGKLREIDPKYTERISVIAGDVNSLNLDIQPEDQEVLNESVQIAMHIAANVRFDCPLEEIVLTNVRGTREMLRIAKSFRKLISFVYMSTAFCHSSTLNRRTRETFYEAPMEPDLMIELAERFQANQDQELMSTLTEKFIYPWPNTYSFSKAISEELVRRAGSDLPISIVRPSIVVATHEDPIPAYCTNYFGLNGVLAAVGAGLSRIVLGNVNNVANIVCADFVINSTLAIVWDQVINKKITKGNAIKDPQIFTLDNGHKGLTWGLISDSCNAAYSDIPWENSIWMPRTNYTRCPFMEFWLLIIYQLVPGILIDSYLCLTGNSKRLLPIYRRMVMFMLFIKFFMNNEWHFDRDNINDVISRMTPFDRKYFPVVNGNMDFLAYAPKYATGLRMYMAKEPMDNLEQARRKYTRQKIAHYSVLVVYYSLVAGFYYLVLRQTGVVGYVRSFVN